MRQFNRRWKAGNCLSKVGWLPFGPRSSWSAAVNANRDSKRVADEADVIQRGVQMRATDSGYIITEEGGG